jgi:predicted DsbA family dithiol-disulfide isomerase
LGAQVSWLPFDLHPEYPAAGISRAELEARYGGAFHERLRQSFEALDLVYNPPAEVVPNTMRALRLTELAREQALHPQMHDRLMRAYWEEGRDIGDGAELFTLAVEIGLDEDRAAEVIAGDAFRARVLASTAQAQSIGVTGVPGFLLDRRLLVLGAQPRPVFEQALERLAGNPPGNEEHRDAGMGAGDDRRPG